LALDGRAEKPVRKRASSKIKSAEEIILGTRSVDGRTQLTVHEKHVVAFAPPAVLILQNGHGDTEKVTTACGFHPDVIALAIQVFLLFDEPVGIHLPLIGPTGVGLGLPKLRVEIERVRRKRLGVGPIIEIEIEQRNFFPSFIDHSDASVFLKGHGEKWVQRAVIGDGAQLGFPSKVVAEAEAKDIAEGNFYTGRAFNGP